MKICVFTDVHGNYEQLKKLVKTEDFITADKRICLGDVVGLGPYQKECMNELSKFDYDMVMGNHEARMIYLINDLNPTIDPMICKQFDENRQKLSIYMDKFKNLPFNYDLVLGGKKFRFTHYGWSNNNMANRNILLKDKSLTQQFGLKDGEFDYVIYGHIHSPSDIVEGKTHFIDVGSLGLKSPSNYLIIEVNNNQIVLTKKLIDFDKDKFLKDCEKLNFPKWEQLLNFSFDNDLEKKS